MRDLIRGIVKGLDYLHNVDKVHGDLKPNNIFISLSPEGMLDAKLSGIGLKWRYGKSKGTVGWRAKEIIEGGRHSKYSDMFSLGCVISYCILGSHRLFGANHEIESNVVDSTPYKDLLSFFPEASHLVLAIAKNKI